MAIIDVNPITKGTLDNTITNTANEIERCMARWKRLAEKIVGLSDADLTSLGYDTETKNYIGAFRVALEDIEKAYQNNTAGMSGSDASYAVQTFAQMVIW